MQIHLLSGEIHSGKTTWLKEHLLIEKACCGILSPLINGKRYFLNISTRETVCMEASPNEKEVLEIGKYKFSVNAFNWAIQQIESCLNQPTATVIIDEVGPLELQGKGFASILNKLLSSSDISDLVLVVRQSAVSAVLKTFHIDPEKVSYINWTPYSV